MEFSVAFAHNYATNQPELWLALKQEELELYEKLVGALDSQTRKEVHSYVVVETDTRAFSHS